MKRIVTYISVVVTGVCMCLLNACSNELPFDEPAQVQGVDRSKMVNIDLPLWTQSGMDKVVISRTGEETDMWLSSVLVMVYEAVDTKKPELNKLIGAHFYNQPGKLEGSSATEGWYIQGSDRTKGVMRMVCPVGDVYIYLVANWTNAFIEFAQGVTEEDLKNPDILPKSQRELIEKFVPTWNGNVHTVDGKIPMIATVNNSTGLCNVSADGKITYKDNQNKLFTISSDINAAPDGNTAFEFKRLMAKLTMTFKTGGVVGSSKKAFIPVKYALRNGASYISPTTTAWTELFPQHGDKLMEVMDSKNNNFGSQTPNKFTIYLPENIETGAGGLAVWKERERVEKDASGKNIVYGKEDQQAGKYVFANAPKYATYVEVAGRFEDPDNGIISAETRFFIHLGAFGSYDESKPHNYDNFSVERDHHYIVDVTVSGVNDIVAESKDASDEAAQNPGLTEINPAEEGLVYIGGLRAYCDAHYDQVEFEIGRSKFENDFAVIFSQTPFGSISLFYYPADGQRAGYAIDAVTRQKVDLNDAKKYIKWVRMRKQKERGSLVKFPSTPAEEKEMVTIFQALDEAWKNTGTTYYTCFIDEYYYAEHPINPSKEIHLRDFINQRDRSIALGKNMHVSKDGSSVSVDAITVVYQKAISTFYDLDKFELVPYGVESISEMGSFNTYGAPSTTTYDSWNGKANTLGELKGVMSTVIVNWKKNGWLLSPDGTKLIDSGKGRLLDSSKGAYVACLAKNRDFNGNGIIDADELRWFNPTLNQLLGIWIGEPALPKTAHLYKGLTSSLKSANTIEGGIYASSQGSYRVLWAEQGCSYGGDNKAEARAIRNLGAHATDFVSPPSPFYKYNSTDRTVEVYLSDAAMRTFSPGELAPHHERSAINRVYKKIQMADHPFIIKENSYCEKYKVYYGDPYWKLRNTGAIEAKTNMVTMAHDYSGTEVYQGKKGDWRLPNQRELALMVMAVGPNFQVNEIQKLDENNYHQVANVCYLKLDHGNWISHNPAPSYNEIIHCRTKFSNCELDGGGYTPYGFAYNTKDNKIHTMWKDPDKDANFGMGNEGIAGYFCVRDVQ